MSYTLLYRFATQQPIYTVITRHCLRQINNGIGRVQVDGEGDNKYGQKRVDTDGDREDNPGEKTREEQLERARECFQYRCHGLEKQ